MKERKDKKMENTQKRKWYKFSFNISDVVCHKVWKKIPELNKEGTGIAKENWFLDILFHYIREEFSLKFFGKKVDEYVYEFDSKNGTGLIHITEGFPKKHNIYAFRLSNIGNYRGIYDLEIAQIDSFTAKIRINKYDLEENLLSFVCIDEVGNFKAKYRTFMTNSESSTSIPGTSVTESYEHNEKKEFNFKTGELVTKNSENKTCHNRPLH